MKNDKLPPILRDLHRISPPETLFPSIVVFVDFAALVKENKKRTPNAKKIHSLDFYLDFWIELYSKQGPSQAFDCAFHPETYSLDISIYDEGAKPVGFFSQDVSEEGMKFDRQISQKNDDVLKIVLFVMHLMTRHKRGDRQSIFTAQRNKASVWYREGDNLKFKRIHDFRRLPSSGYTPPEPGSSGIKKKDHAVKGHWRHYKSGAKVWVRPHRRGDPELGTTTNIFT
jgi:hypothetical protein